MLTLDSSAARPLPFELPLEQLAEICRRYRVRSLALFGSALRDDFGPESDVDLLVEFQPGATPGLGFFGMEIELSEAIGRQVDLNTPACFGPALRAKVMAEAQQIYVAA
jgi:predicted nucleotidyltransferase